MKIFDTLLQKKQPFSPREGRSIGMYVCGPTVYDVAHLGHARAAVAFDVIRRYFTEWKKWPVTFVSNITDVDDKIIRRAADEKISEAQLAARIIPEYRKDYDALRIVPPDKQPRATEYIPQMIALVEKLMEKDCAYALDDGVYFDVSKAKGYGKLSHQNLEQLRAGARVEVNEQKRNPEDFALWKAEKPGEPSWEGPKGMRGRPGWHIECSAMSMDILGETIDIHGGGIDLVFPHHEDERAQSEAATEKIFARLWLHNGHVQVNREKMSKSLGNFFTIKDIVARWNPLVVRYFLLSTHYRMPIEFSDDLLEQARQSLGRLRDFVRRLRAYTATVSSDQNSIHTVLADARMNFEKAMDEDFEIVQALAVLFDCVRDVNRAMDQSALSDERKKETIDFMEEVDQVLGVLDVSETIDTEIESLIAERNVARTAKNFQRSDEIRKELEDKGIILEDTKDGTVWKRAL